MTIQQFLSNVQVRHFVPGRVRIKIGRRFWASVDAAELQDFLEKMEGVRRVRVRPYTGSVIIEFSGDIQALDEFASGFTGYILTHASAFQHVLCPSHEKAVDVRRPCRSPISSETLSPRTHLLAFLGLGGILVSNLLKRILFGSSMAQGPFSLAGVVSVVSALVLWSARTRHMQPHHRRLVPVLNMASLIAVVASESLTAVEILFVGHLSLWAEEQSERRTARYVEEFFPTLPETVQVVENGVVCRRALSEISPGQLVVVGPLETVPVDGNVLDGCATVEEAHLSGRAMPRTCRQGHRVYAGSRVLEGKLLVETEKNAQESSLAQIHALVREGLAQRTSMERAAEVFSRRSLKLGAWATAVTFMFTGELRRAMTVFLVFSCPCAMVLAASSVVTTALLAMWRRGVFVKSGRTFEMVSLLDAVCFDKTGTLTAGLLSVHGIYPRAPWMAEDDILLLAAAAEKDSPHPVAVALRRAVESIGRQPPVASQQEVVPGLGVRAQLHGETILVGNALFMEKHGVAVGYFAKKAQEHRRHGRLVIYVARNGRLQGLVAFGSQARENLQAFLQSLRHVGFRRLDLVSGDSATAVALFAQGLGFDDVQGDLDPEAKARWVVERQNQGYRVLMVGDGINDSPAFSRADVSTALRPEGAPAALEAADVVILDGDVRKILLLRRAGQKMLRLAHQNFALAVMTNVIGFAVAVTGTVGPGPVGLLHLVHTVGILMNSARMFRIDSQDRVRSQDPLG